MEGGWGNGHDFVHDLKACWMPSPADLHAEWMCATQPRSRELRLIPGAVLIPLASHRER